MHPNTTCFIHDKYFVRFGDETNLVRFRKRSHCASFYIVKPVLFVRLLGVSGLFSAVLNEHHVLAQQKSPWTSQGVTSTIAQHVCKNRQLAVWLKIFKNDFRSVLVNFMDMK